MIMYSKSIDCKRLGFGTYQPHEIICLSRLNSMVKNDIWIQLGLDLPMDGPGFVRCLIQIPYSRLLSRPIQ